MGDFSALFDAVVKGDKNGAITETQKALDAGSGVQEIIDNGLIAAMDEVGDRFSKGTIFVPQMLRSAKTMQGAMDLLKPYFKEGDVTTKGKILMGTVKGDLHDIGKNLVSMMLEGAGFTITDLGVDIAPDKFVQKAQEIEPDIVGMSALLSTTMPSMSRTVEAFQEAGIRGNFKVIIGGAPVTDKYAQEIKADGYASDAGSAVTKVKQMLGIS
ncbi:MAG: B12-binding domain-containing protein [Dehalococcoidia bacterium]